MAVERPPKGMTPNLLNGLRSGTRRAKRLPLIKNRHEGSTTAHLEKIQTSFATSRITVSLMVVPCGLPFVLKLLVCEWVRLYVNPWNFWAAERGTRSEEKDIAGGTKQRRTVCIGGWRARIGDR